MNCVFWLGDLTLHECSGFRVPQVKPAQESSCVRIRLLTHVSPRGHARTQTHARAPRTPPPLGEQGPLSLETRHETPFSGRLCAVPLWPLTAAATNRPAQVRGRRDADLHRLRGELDHVLHALTVVMSGLFLIDHIPLVLGKVQEAADGTEVLPERAVLWAGVLLPAEQFAQPALGKERQRQGPLG